MKKFNLFLLTLLTISWAQAQNKKMCITVDDLPTVTYGINEIEFKQNITQKLVDTFVKYNVPAIGYVNEVKLYNDGKLTDSDLGLLKYWLENGMDLGNHTYSHPNYHQVGFDAFTKDILKGQKVLVELLPEYGKELKFFRHPYLRSGANQAQKDSLSQFLKTHHYIEAPVTIDNADYLFAYAYSKAYKAKDQSLMRKIGTAYVQYMEEKLLYFEQSAQALFERNINQILLCHASLLNAEYMDELLDCYQKHGYQFVSQEEVLKDPAYQSKETRFGDWGISWLDRWALSQGKKADFFKNDPVTPSFIQEMNQ
ncbi:polysaccharide deacetylase family protein [Echinicola sp. 20G]|uniref:polysaccharide deacetylase family protein n=1 Tax=Echinicola sp. 20G TaxID=2781961 RepID=UPI0019103183|nr:polysaccharide deacetylase family protein [Echinicola sp. 20G]